MNETNSSKTTLDDQLKKILEEEIESFSSLSSSNSNNIKKLEKCCSNTSLDDQLKKLRLKYSFDSQELHKLAIAVGQYFKYMKEMTLEEFLILHTDILNEKRIC